MEVIIEPDHTPYLYDDDYTMVYLTSEQIRSIKQLIDYEQLYETNTDVNEMSKYDLTNIKTSFFNDDVDHDITLMQHKIDIIILPIEAKIRVIRYLKT